MLDRSDVFTRAELVVLAGAVREMMRADGTISEGEAEMAAGLAAKLGLDDAAWRHIWEEANRRLPNVEAVMTAATNELTTADVRERVYEILYEIATDGTIVDSEWDLLEWLDEAWRFVDSRQRK